MSSIVTEKDTSQGSQPNNAVSLEAIETAAKKKADYYVAMTKIKVPTILADEGTQRTIANVYETGYLRAVRDLAEGGFIILHKAFSESSNHIKES